MSLSTTCHPDTGCEKCPAGWTGGDCSEDIDECNVGNNTCGNLASCTNELGTYSCHCYEGYYRVNDICKGRLSCLFGNALCVNHILYSVIIIRRVCSTAYVSIPTIFTCIGDNLLGPLLRCTSMCIFGSADRICQILVGNH